MVWFLLGYRWENLADLPKDLPNNHERSHRQDEKRRRR